MAHTDILHSNRIPAMGRQLDREFCQETVNRLTAHLLSWRQAPGAIGGLHLHSCWGETSVLRRKYHGQTVWQAHYLIKSCILLYEMSHDEFWKDFASDAVANVLFLQSPAGGFVHAAGEFEPTYTADKTCPIHQGLPILGLLLYEAWPAGEAALKRRIRPAIDRHWQWFQEKFWMAGNVGVGKIDRPGWCGVTNQDLVIIAALTRYGSLYGDWSRYEQFGKPALDAYLSPQMYFAAEGLFERGDRKNQRFAERTPYYGVILEMLKILHGDTREARIAAASEAVTAHLFEALVKGPDGLAHLAWGAEMTPPGTPPRRTGWTVEPYTLSGYLPLIGFMSDHARRTGDAQRAETVRRLEETVAAYVFDDGIIAGAVQTTDPLLSIAPLGSSIGVLCTLLTRLGPDLRPLEKRTVHTTRRIAGDLSWTENARFWSIAQAGKTLYRGIKSNPGAVAAGEEELAGFEAQTLDVAHSTQTMALR